MRKVMMALIVASGLMFIPTQAIGQQVCGTDCVDCGWKSWEGIVDASHVGPWGQTCDFNPIQGYCSDCIMEPEAVAADRVDALMIAETLDVVTEAELEAAVEAYGARLRINPAKRQVVVVGTACDGSAVGAVVNFSEERWNALGGAGLVLWEPPVAYRLPAVAKAH